MYTLRQSEMDRQDQLDMLDAWTPSLESDRKKLEDEVHKAMDKLKEHDIRMAERLSFRNKLVESLR